MRLFSYIVARDYGFAPNPFYGYCTLATCKPRIRAAAEVDDWVIGTGSRTRGHDGHMVYAMRVTETLSFDQYWCDARFAQKRPELHGSRKQAFGDNIYHQGKGGEWLQENSHHSLPDGSPNPLNVKDDTSRPRVLISDDFAYWGGDGPKLTVNLRRFPDSQDICHDRQGERSIFPEALVEKFERWFRSLNQQGCIGKPERW